MKAEGWYRDPYRTHEDRWYSDGTATSLVRDAGVDSEDPPPSGVIPAETLEPSVPPEGPAGPSDLQRADDPGAGATPDYGEEAFEAFGGLNPPGD